MARLRGVASFVVIAAVVLGVLRLVYVVVPLIFADLRPGPFELESLDEVERHVGFSPLVPAYRPIALGTEPPRLSGARSPYASVVMVWRGERYLTVSERRGGRAPDHPPTSRPLTAVADSLWWSERGVHHAILRRDGLWVSIETDLPSGDLRRLADTLTPYRARPRDTGATPLMLAAADARADPGAAHSRIIALRMA
jgi:hypothetical protein